MIQAKCIEKFRNNNNQIVGYRLIDLNGQTQDVRSDILKNAIKNNTIHVVNLRLTSDNRLVDTTERMLKLKDLEESKSKSSKMKDNAVNNNNIDYEEVAKAAVYINKTILDIGDDYNEIVENAGYFVDLELGYIELKDKLDSVFNTKGFEDLSNKINYNTDEDTVYDIILTRIYRILLSDKPRDFEEFFSYCIDDRCDDITEAVKFEHNRKSSDSEILKSLSIIYNYAVDKGEKKLAKKIKALVNSLKSIAVVSTYIGYEVGHRYFEYLNSTIFGTITNSCSTVGHVIKQSDIKEHKEYKGYTYVFHKEFNKINLSGVKIGALFMSNNKGGVTMDVKLARCGYDDNHNLGIVGYIEDITSIDLDINMNIHELAEYVGNLFNNIGKTTIIYVERHPELMEYAKYNEVIKKY